ncbi:hypothetical protein LXL04_004394 [Taraxacum kok-saghyz]
MVNAHTPTLLRYLAPLPLFGIASAVNHNLLHRASVPASNSSVKLLRTPPVFRPFPSSDEDSNLRRDSSSFFRPSPSPCSLLLLPRRKLPPAAAFPPCLRDSGDHKGPLQPVLLLVDLDHHNHPPMVAGGGGQAYCFIGLFYSSILVRNQNVVALWLLLTFHSSFQLVVEDPAVHKSAEPSGSLRSANTPPSKGPPMMTRGRAHPLTGEEPTITMIVAGTYWQDSQTAATMIDGSVTHSFVSRYIFFRFLHIHSLLLAHSRCVGKLAGQWLPRLRRNRRYELGPQAGESCQDSLIYILGALYQVQLRELEGSYSILVSGTQHKLRIREIMKTVRVGVRDENVVYNLEWYIDDDFEDEGFVSEGLNLPNHESSIYELLCAGFLLLLVPANTPNNPNPSRDSQPPPAHTPTLLRYLAPLPLFGIASAVNHNLLHRASVPASNSSVKLLRTPPVFRPFPSSDEDSNLRRDSSSFFRPSPSPCSLLLLPRRKLPPAAAFPPCLRDSGDHKGPLQPVLLLVDLDHHNHPPMVAGGGGQAYCFIGLFYSSILVRNQNVVALWLLLTFHSSFQLVVEDPAVHKSAEPSGSLRSANTPPSKGPPMMTRGRAHPLTGEEPTITMIVAGTYWQDSQTAATMIDGSVTHSFVSRYIFFRFLHIHSLLLAHSRCVGKLAGQWLPRLRRNRRYELGPQAGESCQDSLIYILGALYQVQLRELEGSYSILVSGTQHKLRIREIMKTVRVGVRDENVVYNLEWYIDDDFEDERGSRRGRKDVEREEVTPPFHCFASFPYQRSPHTDATPLSRTTAAVRDRQRCEPPSPSSGVSSGKQQQREAAANSSRFPALPEFRRGQQPSARQQQLLPTISFSVQPSVTAEKKAPTGSCVSSVFARFRRPQGAAAACPPPCR